MSWPRKNPENEDQPAPNLNDVLEELRQVRQEIENAARNIGCRQQSASVGQSAEPETQRSILSALEELKQQSKDALGQANTATKQLGILRNYIERTPHEATWSPPSIGAPRATMDARAFDEALHQVRLMLEEKITSEIATLRSQSEQQLAAPPDSKEAPAPPTLVLFDTADAGGREALRLALEDLHQELEDSGRATVESLQQWFGLLMKIYDESQQESTDWTQRESLSRLDRELFAWRLEPTWDDISEDAAEYKDAPLHRLRECEESVRGFARQVRHELFHSHGVRPLKIVLGQTKFDPSQHESNEYLSRQTLNRDEDKIICEVERRGYEHLSPERASTVLLLARVGRCSWRAPQEPAPELSDSGLPSEDSEPQVLADDSALFEDADGEDDPGKGRPPSIANF